MLDEAIKYAKRGWRVFPLRPKEKKPLIKEWQNKASKEYDQIAAWWQKWPDANIALACGKDSGVFVIDVDGPEGEKSWSNLTTRIPGLTDTLSQKTGRGRQFFFQYPEGRDVRNKQSVYDGIDIRGEGGYVVIPSSIHPNGKTYTWITQDNATIVAAPIILLNKLYPMSAPAPWEQPLPNDKEFEGAEKHVFVVPEDRQSDIIFERARKYLGEIPPAVQGSGGHDSLLWAWRCMLVGFELSDREATELMTEWNDRCSPPWDLMNESEAKDFFRKRDQAKKLSFSKSSGWLKSELGLMEPDETAVAFGEKFAEKLLSKSKLEEKPAPLPLDDYDSQDDDKPFPLHCYPVKLQEHFTALAEAQQVDVMTFAGMALPIIGAALGNTYKLRITDQNDQYDVPAILWLLLVSRTGSNKSGPFRAITKPMKDALPLEKVIKPMMNPQPPDAWVGDVTTSSVIRDLKNAPRGLLLVSAEAVGWIGAFDRWNAKGSKGPAKANVDESIWLQLWDGDSYHQSRKGEDEPTKIHAASINVLGAIQPKKLEECIDPSSFASGLIPRLLIVKPPRRRRRLCNKKIDKDIAKCWQEVVMYLRSQPFAGMNPNTGEYTPNIITLSPAAYARFDIEYSRIDDYVFRADDTDPVGMFYGKAAESTARMALVLHAMEAGCGEHKLNEKVAESTMLKAIELQQWFTDVQLKLYGIAGKKTMTRSLCQWMERFQEQAVDGVGYSCRVYKPYVGQKKRWLKADDFYAYIERLLVDTGKIEWLNDKRSKYKIIGV